MPGWYCSVEQRGDEPVVDAVFCQPRRCLNGLEVDVQNVQRQVRQHEGIVGAACIEALDWHGDVDTAKLLCQVTETAELGLEVETALAIDVKLNLTQGRDDGFAVDLAASSEDGQLVRRGIIWWRKDELVDN